MLLNKTIEEINISDISRMLRQDILIAVSKSIEILNINPLAGEMYDGQLLELLYSVDLNKYKEYVNKIKDILIKIKNNIDSFEWICTDDSKEYLEILEKYLKKISWMIINVYMETSIDNNNLSIGVFLFVCQ